MLYSEWDEYYKYHKEGFLFNENYPKAITLSLIMRFLEPSKLFLSLPASFGLDDLGTWGFPLR